MYVKAERLLELGVSRKTIESKVTCGEWKVRNSHAAGEDSDVEILLSSLPQELQAGWANNNLPNDYTDRVASLLSESSVRDLDEHAEEIKERLVNMSPEERRAWVDESLRMSKVVERYGGIEPKRRRDPATGRLDFVPGVYELCRDAACANYVITSKRPHRSKVMSPFTLNGLYRAYLRKGFVVFLPKQNKKPPQKQDKRRAAISEGAFQWINQNWHRHTGPYPCYDKLKKESLKHGWKIPSKTWFYRLWRTGIPLVIRTRLLEGKRAYIAKHEPYVPRDNSGLEALQILCGDHSERDVMVYLPNGSLARPWLTIWYDLRTGLIWGWHLSLVPSSHTAGLAYADGVRNFGAQPISRPQSEFYSYVYTDRGRDYRSHRWDGKVISVHKEAMRLDGGIEWLCVQRRVGILDELKVKHLLARGRNPKEKPVERIHKDLSCWEANTFAEYCGGNPQGRPDKLIERLEEHKRFEKGTRRTSPFISFESYRERLAERITEYNMMPHERPTLGSRKVIPVEEYRLLYTTRYEIDQETMALLLMKSERRVIGKNGVQCFQKHWFYFDEAMSVFKGSSVEIRYSDEDYTKVFVVLPNARMCEAQRINPTSILKPDKETVERIRRAKANERKLTNEFELLTHSLHRGETVEDRVARELQVIEEHDITIKDKEEVQHTQGRVHQLTRLDRARPRRASGGSTVTSVMVSQSEPELSIFAEVPMSIIKEFDYDE
jgi:hypothetical protein